MATRLQCKGDMDAMASSCPHCGYDFPLQSPAKTERRGIADTALANLSLVIGMLCTVLGAIAVLIAAVAALLEGTFRMVFASAMSFFILLVLYEVFQRVADMV